MLMDMLQSILVVNLLIVFYLLTGAELYFNITQNICHVTIYFYVIDVTHLYRILHFIY